MICKLCNKQMKDDPYSLCDFCGPLVMDKVSEKFERGLIKDLPESGNERTLVNMTIEEMFFFSCQVQVTIHNLKQCKGN